MFETLIILILLAMTKKKKTFRNLLDELKIRMDSSGSGLFGASRGNRKHNGVDFLVKEWQPVYMPFDGEVVRIAYPYSGETKWKGLVLKNDAGEEVKIFYINPENVVGKRLNAGEIIGYAQSISKKYGGSMKDHIHVELRDNGVLKDFSKRINSLT